MKLAAVSQIKLRRRLATEGVLVGTTQLLVVLAYGIGFRLITEAYSSATFGEATLLLGIVAFVFALVVNPLLSTHFRFYPEYRERGLERWFASRIRGYLARVLLAIAAPGILLAAVWSIVQAGQLIAVALVLLAALAGQAWFTLGTNTISARRQQGRLLPLRVLRTTGYPALAALLAYTIEPSLALLLAAGAASYWIPVLVTRVSGWAKAAHDAARPPSQAAAALQRTAFAYGGPFVIIALATWISSVGDRYLLAAHLSMSDVGAYAAIYGLFTQPYLMLAGGLAMWLRPVLFDAMAAGDVIQAQRLLRRWIRGALVCSLTGTLALWLTRSWWFDLLLAEEYHRGGWLVLFLLIASSMHVVTTVLSHHLMAAKQTRAQLLPLVVAAAVNVTGNLLLIPRWGLDGAGLATAISFTMHALLIAAVVRRVSLHQPPSLELSHGSPL